VLALRLAAWTLPRQAGLTRGCQTCLAGLRIRSSTSRDLGLSWPEVRAAFGEKRSSRWLAAPLWRKHQMPSKFETPPARRSGAPRFGAHPFRGEAEPVRRRAFPPRFARVLPGPRRARRVVSRRYMRFTSANSANSSTPPHPSATPCTRAAKNRMLGLKIASGAGPCRCSGGYSAESMRSSSATKLRTSSVADGTRSTVISSAPSTNPSNNLLAVPPPRAYARGKRDQGQPFEIPQSRSQEHENYRADQADG
jgi:hypothetical protein